ncbi:MAG: tRNA (guanosine(46)-N7)-methyltransferase TrmB [Wenzhouxiangella sp.]
MTDSDLDERHHRRIRSFVRRPGRMTESQKEAIETLLPVLGVPADCNDLRALFERPAPLIVEIGCGNGQAMAWMANNEPEHNFVGIEVHEPGVGRLLRSLHDQGSSNVRVAMRDAVEVLEQQVLPASLDQVRIYFPDPWHKKRHHKRRLIQPPFLELLAERIKPGGLLHLATDWAPYAEWMLEALAEVPVFRNQGSPFLPRPAWRPQTHFERRGERRGHDIVDLLLKRQ